MKNNTQKSPKYFRHLESGEIYFEGLDQKRKLNLINQKTSSEYYLPGQYGEHDYFPFEEIPQPPAPIKEDARHTPGELPEKLKTVTFGKGSLSVFEIHERKNNRSIYSVEHFDKDQRIFNETVSSAIVTRYNEYPTLLKENEQLKYEVASQTVMLEESENEIDSLKEQVNVLREALQLLTNSTNLSKLNIRKDFTLINAHANGLKALKKTETN